jgi:membrane protease YdiL (CAAX protease family)
MKIALHVLRGIAGLVLFLALVSLVQVPLHAAHVPSALGALVLIAAAFVIYTAWVRLAERRSVRELSPRGGLAESCAGIAGGILLFACVVAVISIAGGYHVRGYSSATVALVPLLVVFAGAVVEELAFRGLLFRTIQDAGGTWVALGVSALFFGLAHAANPGSTVFSSFAIAIEAGVLLAVAYLATRRLWLPIGIHAGWNFAEGAIFGTSVSGTGHPVSIVHATLTGSPLLTGGAFGPEASVEAILICVLASIVLYQFGVKRTPVVEAPAS